MLTCSTVAFDVVGEFTLSHRFGLLEAGEDIGGMLGDINKEVNYRYFIVNMPWLDHLLRKNLVYAYFNKPSNKFAAHAFNLVQQRRAEEKTGGQEDFMDRYLKAQRDHPEIVTDNTLISYVSMNFLAGSDTTAAVLRSVVYYVLKNPAVHRKLQDEIDAMCDEFPVPNATAVGLPYLDAVVHEALRIHPILNVLQERIVPEGGVTLPSGTTLPAGTVACMTAWTLHWDKTIYGDDSEVFKPERWLPYDDEAPEAAAERITNMKRHDFAFSHGPRVCIGRYIALMEIYKVVPTMFGLLDVSGYPRDAG